MEDMEQIYKQYMPQVYKYLFSLCRDHHLAEELTQETFYQALKSIDGFRGECRLYVWLCQIAKHLWIKDLNRKKKENKVELKESIPLTETNVLDDSILREEKMTFNTIYIELKARKGGELFFNGYTKETQDDSGRANGGTSYLKAFYVEPFAGEDNYSRWESEIKNENSEYVWTFEFADKIVVIKNGELVSEKDK